MSSGTAYHVVFLNIKATGHVNPTLSIVAALKARGCQITYFVDEDLRGVVEAAGASWRPFRPGQLPKMIDEAGIAKYVPPGTPQERYEGLPQIAAREAELLLPALLEDLAALEPKPAAIVHDPFISFGGVAAHVLGVPAIATLTMPGPASMAKPKAVQQAWEAEPWVDGPRRALMESYGFDIFEHAMPMEFYSPVLNLVTTIDELFMPPAPGHQQERFGTFPFKMVGLLADASVKRIANANVKSVRETADAEAEAAIAAMDEALAAGKKAIYISMGTVASCDYFYMRKFGHFGRDNGLTDIFGKQFLQHVFRCCFQAFGDRDDVLAVLSLGPQDDVLDGLPPMPANFVVGKAMPQLQLLQRCSAFLTHGGANSMHEGLGHGVPMAVVPMFGDQPINGDAIARCGAGINFRMPMDSVTPESLRSAVDRLVEPGRNVFREAARDMAKKLDQAGGSAYAADAILEAVQDWEKRPQARKQTEEEVTAPRLLGHPGSSLNDRALKKSAAAGDDYDLQHLQCQQPLH